MRGAPDRAGLCRPIGKGEDQRQGLDAVDEQVRQPRQGVELAPGLGGAGQAQNGHHGDKRDQGQQQNPGADRTLPGDDSQ